MIVKRLLGIVLLLVGLSGLAASVAGVVYGPQFVEQAFSGLDANLEAISANLATVDETFVLAKGIVTQVGDGLDTVAGIADGASATVEATRPMLEELNRIVSNDVPASLEAVEGALPAMATAAGVVEDTLVTISNLSLEQRILGIPIRFDLGLEYAPDVRMDQSIGELSGSLDGMPDRLRGLEEQIEGADSSLGAISQDVAAVSSDLQQINRQIEDVEPLLDDYARMVQDVQLKVDQTQTSLSGVAEKVRIGLIVILVWFGLYQLVPLYLGWELITAKSSRKQDDDRAVESESDESQAD